MFKIDSSGNFTLLYTFATTDANGYNTNGSLPFGSLVQGTDGLFYGTCQYGGIFGSGTIFKLTSTGTITLLHTFRILDVNGFNVDGANPGPP